MMRAALLTIAAIFSITGCSHMKPLDLEGSEEGVFLYEYSLNKCPSDEFFLPAEIMKDGAEIQAGVYGQYCHGFVRYSMRDQDALRMREVAPVFARAQNIVPCALFVGIPAKHSCTGKPIASCDANRVAGEYADHFTKLLLGESEYRAQTPSKSGEFFESNEDFGRWCRKRIRKKFYGPLEADGER